MKKYIIPCLLCLIWAMSSCKKKADPLPTTMTFVLEKDTLWTTTNVTSNTQTEGTVYITGKSTDGNESVDMTIAGFKGGKGTFVIDYRGAGGNINGNIGMYKKGAEVIMARSGKIVVTDVSTTLISGTFEFHYLQTDIYGSFSAPK